MMISPIEQRTSKCFMRDTQGQWIVIKDLLAKVTGWEVRKIFKLLK